jgi:hypothetical protein
MVSAIPEEKKEAPADGPGGGMGGCTNGRCAWT